VSGDGSGPERSGEGEDGIARAIRRVLLATLLLSMAGTLGDLLLIEHFEDRLQLAPIALLGAGLAVAVLRLLWPSRGCLRALQVTMVLFVLAGVAGAYLHFRGNQQFALEMEVEASALWWESVTGAPPVLAPGAMVYIGLLGLASTYRHPLLRSV
jgi:hypothetical protein